ncbi:hypothetical protein Aperf_G00000067237 [Anoplocephala perfoliata]
MKTMQDSAKSHISSLFTDFVRKEYTGVIKNQLKANGESNEWEHFPLVVSFPSLCQFSSILSQHLLISPLDTLSLFNRALNDIVLGQCETDKKPLRCWVRIVSLPPVPEVFRSTIPRSDFVRRFFALQCTVTRVGPIQVVQLERSYICAKCGHKIKVEADFNQFYSILQPFRCTNTANKCDSLTFNVVSANDSSALHCFQEIRVNERLSCLAVGKMPKSIICCLDADLVNTVRPGDDIILNGILTHRWRNPRVGAPCEIEAVIRANSIENLSEMRFRGEIGDGNFAQEVGKRYTNYWKPAISSGDFKMALRLRDEIVRNICPDVYGMYFVKLSLALVLVGAPPCSDKSDIEGSQIEGSIQEHDERTDFRVRGNLHLLLIGEPSTAKSALLRISCRLAGRAIFTSATGTTAAGLTAAAVRDSAGWGLEAGALVLADGGICAIDEFTSLRGADRAAVHEAMEQQTVSIAKAGLVARLNCRCAVIAASSLSSDGTGDVSDLLPTPLLSRFDLIWRLFDPVDCEAWDSAVAGHILGLKLNDVETEDRALFKSVGQITWTTDELRNYIAWVRGEFQPRLSKGAASLLQQYYEVRRRTLQRVQGAEQEHAIAGRTTLRLLESLVRLTRSHARLMARETTVIEDAIVAIWLMECSIQSTFGRSASAVEVNGHCITPEEVVTRHSIENDFDDILKTVFEKLNLHPEEVDPEWFGSGSSDFRPVCASTQVAKAPREVPDSSGTVIETFKKPENPFDFDFDSFMPIGFDAFDDEAERSLKKVKSVTSENILEVRGSKGVAVGSSPKNFAHLSKSESVDVGLDGNILPKPIPSERTPLKASFNKSRGFLRSEGQIESDEKTSDYSFKNHFLKKNALSEDNDLQNTDPQKASEVLTSSSVASSQPLGKLDSRGKLFQSPSVHDAKSTTSFSKEKCDETAPSPKRPKPSESRKDLLNLQNLAPEDWNFGSIDVDFDF